MQAVKTNKNKNKPDELKCTYDATLSRENLENPKALAKKTLSYNNGLYSLHLSHLEIKQIRSVVQSIHPRKPNLFGSHTKQGKHTRKFLTVNCTIHALVHETE